EIEREPAVDCDLIFSPSALPAVLRASYPWTAKTRLIRHSRDIHVLHATGITRLVQGSTLIELDAATEIVIDICSLDEMIDLEGLRAAPDSQVPELSDTAGRDP